MEKPGAGRRGPRSWGEVPGFGAGGKTSSREVLRGAKRTPKDAGPGVLLSSAFFGTCWTARRDRVTSLPMKELESLALRFRFNERVLERLVEGLTPEDWGRRLEGVTNHAYWILGHLALTRRNLLKGLGQAREPAAWEVRFGRGSLPPETQNDPTPEALVRDLKESGPLIEAALRAMTPEQAIAPYPRTLPDGANTVEGAARFLLWHETYHLGQVGLLRKGCGKPGLA